MANIEINILNTLQNIRTPVLDSLMTFITSLGNGGIIWIIIGILLLLQKDKKYKNMGFTLLLSLIISSIIGLGIIKPIVRRPRPFSTFDFKGLLIDAPLDFSFPSGHTASSFAAATSIYLFGKKLGLYAFLLSILISFSRMYHYVHYPTDVFAGILLGVVSGVLSKKIRDNIELKVSTK